MPCGEKCQFTLAGFIFLVSFLVINTCTYMPYTLSRGIIHPRTLFLNLTLPLSGVPIEWPSNLGIRVSALIARV